MIFGYPLLLFGGVMCFDCSCLVCEKDITNFGALWFYDGYDHDPNDVSHTVDDLMEEILHQLTGSLSH